METTRATQRRLAAILAADVVGFSKLMGQDEEGTLARIRALRRDVIEPKVQEHHGRLVKTTGDGFLVEFASPVEAVRCAVGMQAALTSAEGTHGPSEALQMRIGINLGDIIVEPDGDIYGDGVNVAARLEQIADPGAIGISGVSMKSVRDKLAISFEDRGEQQVKNIARPIRVYALAGAAPAQRAKPLSIADGPHCRFALHQPERRSRTGLLFRGYIRRHHHGTVPCWRAFRDRAEFQLCLQGTCGRHSKGRPGAWSRQNSQASVRRRTRRITAQLIEAPTGAHIWADRYDRDLADLFDVQDEVTRSIVASTQTQVVMNEGTRAERAARPELQTWELAKRGWKNMYIATEDGIWEGRKIGRRIVEIDPTSAKGHQLIAVGDFHLVYMAFAGDPEKLKDEALQEAREAVRLDRHDEYSHWALGMVLGTLFGRLDDSIPVYRQALESTQIFSWLTAALAQHSLLLEGTKTWRTP